MFELPPFILALILIVLGYYFFSTVIIKHIKTVFTKIISDLAYQNELMRQTLVLTHTAFKLYDEKNKDKDFLTEKNFAEEDLKLIKIILSIKV